MTPGQIVVLTLLGTCAVVAVAGFPWERRPRRTAPAYTARWFGFVAVLALVTLTVVTR